MKYIHSFTLGGVSLQVEYRDHDSFWSDLELRDALPVSERPISVVLCEHEGIELWHAEANPMQSITRATTNSQVRSSTLSSAN